MPGDRRTIVRAVAWVLVFVAPAAALASWFTPRPDLDRDDAVDVAVGALAEVDIDAEVDAGVVRSVHQTEDGREIDVWIVPTDVGEEQIELRVQESAGQLVYVDDRIGPDDTERLLTDAQFEAIGEYRDDVTTDRWTARNAAATVAAIVAAAVAWTVSRADRRLGAA